MPSGDKSTPTLLNIYGESPGRFYVLSRETTLIGRDLGEGATSS